MKLALAAVLAISFSFSTTASAQQPDAGQNETKSRALFTAAAEAYDSGDRDEALRLYRQSYELVPRAKTLLNIGVVLSELGNDVEAANTLARYVADPDADRQRVAQVRPVLAELDSKVLRLRLNVRGPSPISVNSETFEGNQLIRVLRVYPGKHIITVGDRRENVEGVAGGIVSVNIDVPITKKVGPPPNAVGVGDPADDRSIVSHPALWTGAVALVAAGVGTGFALSFRSTRDELEEVNNNSDDFRFQQALDLEAKAKDRALFANIAFGVAGVAAVTTVVLALVIDRERDDSDQLTLAPQLGTSSAGVSILGRF